MRIFLATFFFWTSFLFGLSGIKDKFLNPTDQSWLFTLADQCVVILLGISFPILFLTGIFSVIRHFLGQPLRVFIRLPVVLIVPLLPMVGYVLFVELAGEIYPGSTLAGWAVIIGFLFGLAGWLLVRAYANHRCCKSE